MTQPCACFSLIKLIATDRLWGTLPLQEDALGGLRPARLLLPQTITGHPF